MSSIKEEVPMKDGEYIATFKFYDSKHRRLSLFGRMLEGNKMEITVLTVSNRPEKIKKSEPGAVTVSFVFDLFSKKEGREKYESILNGTYNKGKRGKKAQKLPGQRFTIDVTDGRPRRAFLIWAKSRFYRIQEMKAVTVLKPVFVRGDKYVHPKKNESESTETA